jgi:hypothetical protein
MGKMIDAQSIVVASVATNQQGEEGTILRYVFFHSLALAAMVGVVIFLYAKGSPCQLDAPSPSRPGGRDCPCARWFCPCRSGRYRTNPCPRQVIPAELRRTTRVPPTYPTSAGLFATPILG